jgi:hypothetical protein
MCNKYGECVFFWDIPYRDHDERIRKNYKEILCSRFHVFYLRLWSRPRQRGNYICEEL